MPETQQPTDQPPLPSIPHNPSPQQTSITQTFTILPPTNKPRHKRTKHNTQTPNPNTHPSQTHPYPPPPLNNNTNRNKRKRHNLTHNQNPSNKKTTPNTAQCRCPASSSGIIDHEPHCRKNPTNKKKKRHFSTLSPIQEEHNKKKQCSNDIRQQYNIHNSPTSDDTSSDDEAIT
jgi:hypothetical protein